MLVEPYQTNPVSQGSRQNENVICVTIPTVGAEMSQFTGFL